MTESGFFELVWILSFDRLFVAELEDCFVSMLDLVEEGCKVW